MTIGPQKFMENVGLTAVALFAVLLRVVGWFFVDGAGNTIIAVLATMVVVLLARPIKNAVQDVLDRAFYRDRYDYRRALTWERENLDLLLRAQVA